MDRMNKSQLLALAKAKGFKNYSSLNKFDLIELIKRGYHKEPIKQVYGLFKDDGGASEDELFQMRDKVFRYTLEWQPVKGGYFVIGFNMNGMFDSYHVPFSEITHQVTNNRFVDPNNPLDIPPQLCKFSYIRENDHSVVAIRITKPEGWFLPQQQEQAFRKYIANIRQRVLGPQPKTLFELAARIINSHHQKVYLPKIIKKKLAACK